MNKDKKNGFTRRVVSPRASPKLEVCAWWRQGRLDSFQGNSDSRISSFKILEYEGEKKSMRCSYLSKRNMHFYEREVITSQIDSYYGLDPKSTEKLQLTSQTLGVWVGTLPLSSKRTGPGFCSQPKNKCKEKTQILSNALEIIY